MCKLTDDDLTELIIYFEDCEATDKELVDTTITALTELVRLRSVMKHLKSILVP